MALRAFEDAEREVRFEEALQKISGTVNMVTRSRARGASDTEECSGVRATVVGSRSLSEVGAGRGFGQQSTVGAATGDSSAVVAAGSSGVGAADDGDIGAHATLGGYGANHIPRSGTNRMETGLGRGTTRAGTQGGQVVGATAGSSPSVGAEAKEGPGVVASESDMTDPAVVTATGLQSGGAGALEAAPATGIGGTAAEVPGLGGSAPVPSRVGPALAAQTGGAAAPPPPPPPSGGSTSSGDHSSSHSPYIPPSAAGSHHSGAESMEQLIEESKEFLGVLKEREEHRSRRTTELPMNLSRLSGSRREWNDYKMQIFAYLDVKNFPREVVEAAMEEYRANGTHSVPELSLHLRRAFASSLRGNPAAHVQATRDGVGKFVLLAD